MKKWKKPQVITLTEDQIKDTIVAGACSDYSCGEHYIDCTFSYWPSPKF